MNQITHTPTNMKIIEWHGLYNESWQGEIVPEAFSHPAKYSRGMIRQIYAHMIANGYIAPGDHIVDPFGGVGLGALDAMRHGLHWHGCELEPKFVELGNQNLGVWAARYSGWFANWGTAVLHQGDSRQLDDVVRGADGCVSSPPFDTNAHPKQELRGNKQNQIRANPRTPGEKLYFTEYFVPDSPGQLGSMPSGDFDAAIGSPPYATEQMGGGGNKHDKVIDAMKAGYGSTPGNIGNDTGDSFWTASREIVAQVYQVLKPGGYAAWVTGDFVRKGKRVHFGKQWLELCTAVGFEPVEWVVAWKTEYKGTQTSIFDGDVHKQVDRVSFFRRLANDANPDNAILNEDIIIVRKPF